jgi:hypothetical protein
MSDLRIIPAEPWAEARERYRDLACQDRPGDPNIIPFDPREEREPSNPVIFLAAMAVMVIGLAFIGAIQ